MKDKLMYRVFINCIFIASNCKLLDLLFHICCLKRYKLAESELSVSARLAIPDSIIAIERINPVYSHSTFESLVKEIISGCKKYMNLLFDKVIEAVQPQLKGISINPTSSITACGKRVLKNELTFSFLDFLPHEIKSLLK